MGDDSTARNVLSVCSGEDSLYEVIHTRDNSRYIVNEAHILSLKHQDTFEVIDVPISEYTRWSRTAQEAWLGYRTAAVDFFSLTPVLPAGEQPTPYQVGNWLAQGDCESLRVHGIFVDPGTTTGIPRPFKCGTREVRQQLLAGIVDARGASTTSYGHHNNRVNRIIALESRNDDITFMTDVLFVARSLGIGSSLVVDDTNKRLHFHMWWTSTTSSTSPSDFGQSHDMDRMSPLAIVSKGSGAYYGFELDGNGRFALGDFTVTHNTTMALYILSKLQKKGLVVCHKDFLINQWRERIAQFLPNANVGLIKAKVIDVHDKDIVLASLQSLSMKEYGPGVLDQYGFVAIDEVHHTSAEVFSRALPKITSRVMLGLSATLDRKDGLRKVFEWHLGSMVHDPIKKTDTSMMIDMVRYPAHDVNEVYMFNGKLNTAAMLNNLCASPTRNRLIVDKLVEVLRRDPGRRALILSDRRAHLKELERLLNERGFHDVGYYVGGMKEAELDKSAKCEIILGTNMMAAEGMDIPVLNTLVLASPVSSVEQQLGRVQRQKPAARLYVPYTIDIWDDLSIFNNQGVRRGYQILNEAAGQEEEDLKDGVKPLGALAPFAFLPDDV
jgi:Type III restriction enzyme, res subunit